MFCLPIYSEETLSLTLRASRIHFRVGVIVWLQRIASMSLVCEPCSTDLLISRKQMASHCSNHHWRTDTVQYRDMYSEMCMLWDELLLYLLPLS